MNTLIKVLEQMDFNDLDIDDLLDKMVACYEKGSIPCGSL